MILLEQPLEPVIACPGAFSRESDILFVPATGAEVLKTGLPWPVFALRLGITSRRCHIFPREQGRLHVNQADSYKERLCTVHAKPPLARCARLHPPSQT